MKILTITLLFLINFMSCSTAITNKKKEGDQQWVLVKMTGNMMNSETTGQAMQWQEDYILKADGTFSKSRITNGKTQTATGTYIYSELADGMYVELTYPSESLIIGNCTGDLREFLKIVSSEELQGTWLACDGPGLTYHKVQ